MNELKNVLQSNICQIMKYGLYKRMGICEDLEAEFWQTEIIPEKLRVSSIRRGQPEDV